LKKKWEAMHFLLCLSQQTVTAQSNFYTEPTPLETIKDHPPSKYLESFQASRPVAEHQPPRKEAMPEDDDSSKLHNTRNTAARVPQTHISGQGVPEHLLVRDLIFLLQGIDGKYLLFDGNEKLKYTVQNSNTVYESI